ncbi:MAG: type II toxin-antitoxin system PemK/MazF family toxin [Treponema sp.]|nr:type II toxin-antitoxin system PemK/MazF family toxin [Treponema sp.]
MTRGEIYCADYGLPFGSETGFRRPVVIVQYNDFNIKELRTVIALPLTTNLLLAEAPANVFIDKESSDFPKDSATIVSQFDSFPR